MPQPFFEEVRRALSSERFDSYDNSESDSDEEILARYLWNMALCRSLYPALQGLEIALRNSLHSAISARENEDWWFKRQHDIVQGDYGENCVGKAINRAMNTSYPPNDGDVVAELSFGFWTSLFDRRYEQDLWPQLLPDVLPHAPRKVRTAKFMRKKLNQKMKNLRNRVFHHEPIWYWNDLADQHDLALDLIEWMCPAWRITVETDDRFPEVYSNGLSPFKSSVSGARSSYSS